MQERSVAEPRCEKQQYLVISFRRHRHTEKLQVLDLAPLAVRRKLPAFR